MCAHECSTCWGNPASPLSQWHLCPSCQLGQKPGHPPLFLPLSRSTSKPSANVLDSTLSMHPDPTVTLHLHCPHPGPATILSHLDYHGSLLPGLLASHSKRDTVRTPGRSGHSPGPPCILGIKRQLLNTAWPQLILGLHLPPLCSGSPCCPLTGLVTVPLPCTGHTRTSGPSHMLFPAGTLPADTYVVHSLIQVSAQRSPSQEAPLIIPQK